MDKCKEMTEELSVLAKADHPDPSVPSIFRVTLSSWATLIQQGVKTRGVLEQEQSRVSAL